VTLASALDYETATAYEITLTANDGANSVSQTITVNVGDINEAPTVSTTLAASSFAEDVATGTTVATSSASDPESSTITYSLSGTGSSNFSVDANGKVTVASSLDYETTTSYSLTLTASDGTSSTQETITFNVTDVDEFALALSSTSPSINEGVSTGTQVATSTLTQQDSAAVTYSLSGTNSNKFAISSTGVITTAAAMDYETTNSYSLTVTVTDGTNTDTETINISVNNLTLNTLATTLANSGAALAESSSSGTAVASSSINNPDSDTITYTLSGTGSSNFSVDSSGNVTTNATLDFETVKSYALTLTATAGSTSVTDAFTVNVGNVEELESAVLRYSADYNSASRSGFSATATRGPSGSSLAAYTLEQVGTTNSTDITSVAVTSTSSSNNYVPVEINSGTELNWRYYFPVDTSGNGEFAFAPNSFTPYGRYYAPLGTVHTVVSTTIDNDDFLTAGRLESAEYWFMTTDKAAADISYNSTSGSVEVLLLGSWGSSSYLYDSSNNPTKGWAKLVNDLGWNLTYEHGWDALNTVGYSNLSNYHIIIDQRQSLSGGSSGSFNSNDQAAFESWMGTSSSVLWLKLHGDTGCCASQRQTEVSNFISALGGTVTFSGTSGGHDRSSTFAQDSFYYGLNGLTHDTSSVAGYIQAAGNGQKLWCSGPLCTGAYWRAQDLESGTVADFFTWGDQISIGGTNDSWNSVDNAAIATWLLNRASGAATVTTSTYKLYEDQVTLAGDVYKDVDFLNFTSNNKVVIAMAVIPIENRLAGVLSGHYFYPNFIPTTFWSYGDVGVSYCWAVGNTGTTCNTYENNYDFSSYALGTIGNLGANNIDTSRFHGSDNEMPQGHSLWWQILNPNGVGVGLWAQINFNDSYTGAGGSYFRDDQESLLNVVISNVDYRKNDTTRYSAGDTGLGMNGYHYWSYQGATNADNDGLGINYGTSPVECATSNESGCFWGTNTNQPGGAMITSSDPYKSSNMTLGVNYNSNNDTFSTGTFNISAVAQSVRTSGGWNQSPSLGSFRSSDFYSSSATGYSGFFSGILEFDVSGTGNSQLSSIRSSSTLATFTFDTTNDDVQVVAPMTISAAPSNNYTSNWSTVDTGSLTLKFGDATNDEAKSAYISSEVFAAEIQDDGAQIDGTSGGSNNLAGVMVSYNTLDKEDNSLFTNSGNDSMPDTAYSTWGYWAMSAADVSPNSGTQNASVHLGTWVGGEVVDQSEIPTSGSASMSGAAVMNVAYRYNQTGTNYDVHKYTTTADVAATFNWGSSGYSGTLAFTDFDNKNPIIDNAGFASFSVAITGTDNTYTGNSTDSLDNSWLGGASVAGALYGDTSPDESGGRINVNLYKSGDTATAGANDFYMAEGIYLID
jgi:transcriptional/translational regulatory protein YebC/TACO1